jgi:hypothetical protein
VKKQQRCKHCKGTKNEDGFCNFGCDYKEAREFSCREAENRTGCEFGEPFFVINGLKLIANGYEAPYVELKMGENSIMLHENEMQVLRDACYKGLIWCKEGWCPGAC